MQLQQVFATKNSEQVPETKKSHRIKCGDSLGESFGIRKVTKSIIFVHFVLRHFNLNRRNLNLFLADFHIRSVYIVFRKLCLAVHLNFYIRDVAVFYFIDITGRKCRSREENWKG